MASVSIVIPTHLRPHLARRAVESALHAIGQYGEVVVVGDHDNSAEAALSDLLNGPRCRFLENIGRRGASATRNVGVSASKGDLILFLDDDDEMLDGYPQRVLKAAGTHDAVWGFSSQLVRMSASTSPRVLDRSAWGGGFAGSSVPFRRKIGALSAGFWIEKSLFLKVGGLVEDQLIDEDTDLCCRLLSRGIQPWFETEPGTVLDRTTEVVRLTNSAATETRALSYLGTFKRNYKQLGGEPGAVAFLATRAQRMILRGGARKDLVSEVTAASIGLALKCLLAWKRFVYRVRGL